MGYVFGIPVTLFWKACLMISYFFVLNPRLYQLKAASRKACPRCGKQSPIIPPELKHNLVAGTKTPEYCTQHAPDRIVDVNHKKCRTEVCGKIPLFGVAGMKAAEYCAQHTPDRMATVNSMLNGRLRQDSIFWSGRDKNSGIPCTPRPG